MAKKAAPKEEPKKDPTLDFLQNLDTVATETPINQLAGEVADTKVRFEKYKKAYEALTDELKELAAREHVVGSGTMTLAHGVSVQFKGFSGKVTVEPDSKEMVKALKLKALVTKRSLAIRPEIMKNETELLNFVDELRDALSDKAFAKFFEYSEAYVAASNADEEADLRSACLAVGLKESMSVTVTLPK